ncbi:RadC family protein [Pseudomonas aeruginosa]|uniref:RadC family protein n=1 Tax=Pseudomonas aeruginosa TaxID=287 RepID=UPI000F7D644E|nr:DNA repair protein RadC [Pseudomonas aeruginosa]RTB44139.1 DNA repair protein RadC [Pseudomonas aeruginosa]
MTASNLALATTGTSFVFPEWLTDDWIVKRALEILEGRYFKRGPTVASPHTVSEYLRLQLVSEPHEVFAALFLDAHHRVIAFERLFQGSIAQAAVYPRQVVMMALEHRASAMIVAHNHPSGSTEPSQADRNLTARLKDALELIDVQLLDHIIVGDGEFSFAEAGLI